MEKERTKAAVSVPVSPAQVGQPPPRRSPRLSVPAATAPPLPAVAAAPTPAAAAAVRAPGGGGKGEEARLRLRVVCLESALSAKDVEMATLIGTVQELTAHAAASDTAVGQLQQQLEQVVAAWRVKLDATRCDAQVILMAKRMDFALKLVDFVVSVMDFVLKMADFSGHADGAQRQAEGVP